MEKRLSEVEAILKVSGVASFLPHGVQDFVCHSLAIDITNYYSTLIQQARREVGREIIQWFYDHSFRIDNYETFPVSDARVISLSDIESLESRFTAGPDEHIQD